MVAAINLLQLRLRWPAKIKLLCLLTEEPPQELAAGVLRDSVDELYAREPLELRLVVGDVLRDQLPSTLSHVWSYSMAHKPS